MVGTGLEPGWNRLDTALEGPTAELMGDQWGINADSSWCQTLIGPQPKLNLSKPGTYFGVNTDTIQFPL